MKLIYLVLAISILNISAQTLSDSSNNLPDHRIALPNYLLGTKYTLMGRFGKIGQKHEFVATVQEKWKSRNNTTQIHKVNSKDYTGQEDIEMFYAFPVGTKITFEAIEWGELSAIEPLSNPDGENVGQISIRTFCKVTKILAIQTPEIHTHKSKDLSEKPWSGNDLRFYKIAYADLLAKLERKNDENPFSGLEEKTLNILFAEAGYPQIVDTVAKYITAEQSLRVQGSEHAHATIEKAIGVKGITQESE